MAAYAALVSLLNLMEDIQSHPLLSTSLDKKQMESLGEIVGFLLNFVENYNSHVRTKEIEDLERQIASAAHAAEDVIESHVVDQIVAGSTFNVERETQENKKQVQDVREVLKSVKNLINLIIESESTGEFRDEMPENLGLDIIEDDAASTRSLSSSFDDEAIQLLERILRPPELVREIIPIVNMGGTDIQSHPLLSTSLDMERMESLGEIVDFFLNVVENKEIEDLEQQIASAAHAAEDVIESHVVDQIVAGSTSNVERETQEIKKQVQDVTEAMNSIKNLIMESESRGEFRDKMPEYSGLDITEDGAASTRSLSSSKTSTVGFDDEAIQLIERLIRPEPDREIIPIVGMGGTGKTTLARLVYEHSLIAQHFDIFMWATISQEYSLEKIISELLFGKKESTGQTLNELGEQLHKKLWGRRYLIIVDDVWSLETWNEIQMFLPNNVNGDRIIITTRLSNVATHLSSLPFKMNFLDEDKSWKLFCAKAFGEEECPPELEEIGKNIVKKCKGLALSIVVIGGHLRKSSRMKGYWESVSKVINSILDSGEDDNCLGILSLSYNHLPAHLKPCFLYMGIFEEDEEIYAPRLTRLWLSEGLLRPNKDKCKEELAEDYLKDLVDRNLILVRSHDRNGKFELCKIHDLLRELSIKVATKENFFCVTDTTPTICNDRRVVIDENNLEPQHYPEIFHVLRSAPLLRSLKFEGQLSHLKLLRVLINVIEVVPSRGQFELIFQHVNLRYLECRYVRAINGFEECIMVWRGIDSIYHLPPSISLLWNLQTLIISGYYDKIVAPSEIWKMSQLRLLDVRQIYLPDPPQDNLILDKLHTLKRIENLSLSEDVCKRIPNIKTLELIYPKKCDEASSSYCPQNLVLFHKLESLFCKFFHLSNCYDFSSSLTFPSSLQKLVLVNSWLRWEDLAVIGSLPHLEYFMINPALGHEWNPIEMGFPSLKFLFIYECRGLVSWNADSSHFPALEYLCIVYACKLDEIPSTLGDIPTLQCIRLKYCKESAGISALRMLVEQKELGNEDLKLEVTFDKEEELESYRVTMQKEGLTCNNFHLSLSTSS